MLLKLEPTARFTKFLVTGPDPKTKPRLVPSPSNEFLEIIDAARPRPLDGQGDDGRQSRHDDGLQRQCSPRGKPV